MLGGGGTGAAFGQGRAGRAGGFFGWGRAGRRGGGRGGTLISPGYGPIRSGRFGVKNARVVKKVGEKETPLGEKETPLGEKVTIIFEGFLALAGLISSRGGRWRRGCIAGSEAGAKGATWMLGGGGTGAAFGQGQAGAGRVGGRVFWVGAGRAEGGDVEVR